MSIQIHAVTDAKPVRQFNPRRPSARQSKRSRDLGLCRSDLFPSRALSFKAGDPETVVIGGRQNFPLVARPFDAAHIKQILFVGWGSQGPAQAQNLRDTLKFIARSDIKVCVGLRPDSKSIPAAKAAGFTSADGTLGNILPLASKSDLVICLVADGGMVETHQEIFGALKPGAIVGISHGFIVGYLESAGKELPANHDFIMVAPKGMGPSVRKLYLQGAEKEGAGINASVAVRARSQDRTELVREVANAWSVGIGSPVTFGTDFLSEVVSDLFGERSMLLAALWGMVEAHFEFLSTDQHCNKLRAFRIAVSGITGTVTDLLSQHGIKGFYEQLTGAQSKSFDRGYVIGYPAFDGVMDQIYQEVSSLREIQTVIDATKRLTEHPMESIEAKSSMWTFARERSLYGERVAMNNDLAFAAGIYVGGLMAQLHTLLFHGHPVSEVINESFIEAIDSLTPYMDARGVAYMVDNCSTTARLGTRLWGPVFRTKLLEALRAPAAKKGVAERVIHTLFDQPLHGDIGVCMANRPSVRISVPLS